MWPPSGSSLAAQFRIHARGYVLLVHSLARMPSHTSSSHRTFNAGIIMAIIVGLGVGETLFGRYAASRLTVH